MVGLLGALLGGSKTQISGPTAPLSVAMAVVFVDYANQDLGKALAIVALAGLIQVLMGALRLGSYMAYTPYAVVSGFTSAVGLIIILVQFLPLLGSEVALGGALKSLRSWPEAVSNVDPSALVLGVVTLAVCIFWAGTVPQVHASVCGRAAHWDAARSVVAERCADLGRGASGPPRHQDCRNSHWAISERRCHQPLRSPCSVRSTACSLRGWPTR